MKPIVFTFLQQLYRQDKKLFLILLLYGCGILYCIRWSREEFPFLLYGMYSLKEEPKDIYITYSIEFAGQPLKYVGLWDVKKELVTAPIINIGAPGNLTAEKKQALMQWILKNEIKHKSRMDIYMLTCTYNKEGKPEMLNKELIIADGPK